MTKPTDTIESREPRYRDDNPKTIYGEQKTPMDLVPPSAIRTEARVFKHGADKYGAYNWREWRF